MTSLKPWWSARWETVEPEEDLDASCEDDYNDPSDSELLDYEERYELYR